MPKLIATGTVKVNGNYVSPGTEFDADDKTARSLLDSGAAARKMREVPDDADETSDGRDTGANTAPDPTKPNPLSPPKR